MTLLNISVAPNLYKFLQHDWFHFKGLEKHILAEFIMEETSTLDSLIHKLSLIYYWHLSLDPVVARLEKQPQWFKLKMIWVWHDCFEFKSHWSNLFQKCSDAALIILEVFQALNGLLLNSENTFQVWSRFVLSKLASRNLNILIKNLSVS